MLCTEEKSSGKKKRTSGMELTEPIIGDTG